MINNEFTREWLAKMAAATDTPGAMGNAMPVEVLAPKTSPTRWRGWCPTRPATSPASPCRWTRAFEQVAAMARNPVAQTAFGPMVLAAVEQNEPPGRRLVDDDFAELFLPARCAGWSAPPGSPRFVT